MNDTKCYDEGQLQAYLDGESGGPEQQAITTHLEGCERCRGQVEELRALTSGASVLLSTYGPTPNLQTALDRQRQIQHAETGSAGEKQRVIIRGDRKGSMPVHRAASAGLFRAPARPAFVGMGLAVVMVLVLGALVLYGGANRTAGPGKPSKVEWAKFPPELGSSVIMGRQDGYERVRIYPVDPETGESVPNYEPIVVGKSSWPRAFSEDGSKLAVIEGNGLSCEPWAGGRTCRASTDVLHLIDLQTWSEITTSLSLKGSVSPLTFSPDGNRLAMGYHEYTADYTRSDNVGIAKDTIILVDVATAKVIAEKELPFGSWLLEYSQDGSTLAIYGQPYGSPPGTGKPGPPRLLLLDAADLEVTWDQTLEEVASWSWCETNCDSSHENQIGVTWSPATVFSHDRQKLYIVHADEDKLTTVDLKGRTVNSIEVRAARSWFEELLALTADVAQAKRLNNGAFKSAVLSLDGTRLYVSGLRYIAAENEQKQGSLGLEVIDVETGRIVARQETEAMQINGSPDGHHLYLHYWGQSDGWIEVLDAGSLQSVVRMHEWSPAAIRRLNGEQVVVASRNGDQGRQQFAVLDPETFEVTHSWTIHGLAEWVAGP